MDFGLCHNLPGHELPTDWQTLLSEQARALEVILTRLDETVTRVTAHANRQPELVDRVHTLLIEVEQFLMAMMRQNVGFEHETAQLQTSTGGCVGEFLGNHRALAGDGAGQHPPPC
jgi:hypothetical protein